MPKVRLQDRAPAVGFRLERMVRPGAEAKGRTMGNQDMSQQEREQYASLMTEARLKLREAEKAWFQAFAAAPVGNERIFAAAVYERIRYATRRPV